jgi:hypothetical protein
MIIIFATVLLLILDFRILNIMSSHISWQFLWKKSYRFLSITMKISIFLSQWFDRCCNQRCRCEICCVSNLSIHWNWNRRHSNILRLYSKQERHRFESWSLFSVSTFWWKNDSFDNAYQIRNRIRCWFLNIAHFVVSTMIMFFRHSRCIRSLEHCVFWCCFDVNHCFLTNLRKSETSTTISRVCIITRFFERYFRVFNQFIESTLSDK